MVEVGDAELDDAARRVVAAAREALTNAAKFAPDAGPVALYAEVEQRPRSRSSCATAAPGFDPDAFPADRQGVRESIVGRMERHGGTRDDPLGAGEGTEVELEHGPERGMSSRPTVVIVDDHEIFRAGVRAELEGLVDVRADVGSVEEAVRAITELKPDVVLLDVHMPGGGGVEVIRQVAETMPAQHFLALSVSDAAEDVIAVVRAGARGYVTKSISGPELADAIAPRPRRRRRLLARASPASCSTPSPGRSPRPRSTPSSTSSRCASARSCA